MNIFQIIASVLLAVFYLAYFLKTLVLKRQGIAVNQLGKGDKPGHALLIERFLRFTTMVGAFVQFGSVVFPAFLWPFRAIAPMNILGIVLLVFGNLVFISALIAMRENWRAGFDHNQGTSLVTIGVYRLSRNPAFVGFDLLYIGCALAFPNFINIGITALAVILFHLQILDEERFCDETFGQEYLEYKAKVMRYIGRRGRLTAALKSRAKKLKTDIPAVLIALRRKETPLLAKVLAAIAVAYALSPVDLIPDFIPVIGFLDDVILLPGLIALVIKLIPAETFAECREEAADLWRNGRPKRWFYAIPIVAIWLLLVFIIAKLWL